MTTALIFVLILAAFIASRLYRSTKLWWTLLFTISVGLLVGVLSKEVANHSSSKDKDATSYTQSINFQEFGSSTCMQSLVVSVTGSTNGLPEVAGYKENLNSISKKLIDNTKANGRDSPPIEDDS